MKRLFQLDVLLIIIVLLVDSLAVAVGVENRQLRGLVGIGAGRKMYLKCSGRRSRDIDGKTS